jgi:hypothetical protein
MGGSSNSHHLAKDTHPAQSCIREDHLGMNTFRFVLTLTADAQLCLGPLILIGLLALTRSRPQLAILLTAVAGLALLLLGVVVYDISTQLREAFFVVETTFDQGPLDAIAISLTLLGIGGALSFAATVLALSRAAQTQRWGWFAGLAIFLVIGAAASVAAYDRYSLVVWDARFDGQPFFFSPFIGRFSSSSFYFIIWSVVVIIAPLMALLYGAIVRDESAARVAGPLVPRVYAPATAPGYPAPNYPPAGYPPSGYPPAPSPTPPGYPPASYPPTPPIQQAPEQSYPPSRTGPLPS